MIVVGKKSTCGQVYKNWVAIYKCSLRKQCFDKGSRWTSRAGVIWLQLAFYTLVGCFLLSKSALNNGLGKKGNLNACASSRMHFLRAVLHSNNCQNPYILVHWRYIYIFFNWWMRFICSFIKSVNNIECLIYELFCDEFGLFKFVMGHPESAKPDERISKSFS